MLSCIKYRKKYKYRKPIRRFCKRLGKILDMAFTPGGQITGIIVPGDRKFLKNITGSDSVFVPWKCIVRIGEDTILVELGRELPPSPKPC